MGRSRNEEKKNRPSLNVRDHAAGREISERAREITHERKSTSAETCDSRRALSVASHLSKSNVVSTNR